MVSTSFAKKVFAIFLSVWIVACSQDLEQLGSREFSVVDGKVITLENRKNNLPSVSVVKVMHWGDEGSQGSCTGVLVSKRFVLTAAHCLDSSSSMKVIRVAFQFTPEKIKVVPVVRYQIHPKYIYSKGNQGDLALVMLKTDAPRGYAPARLLKKSFWKALTEKEDGYVEYYGYGCGTRPYTPNSDCAHGVLRKGSTQGAVYFSDMIRWRNGNGAVCGGDSGGPAFKYVGQNFYLTGIAASIHDNLTPELRNELNSYYAGNKWEFYAAHPELNECQGNANYTDLASYHDWLQETQKFLSESNH